MKILAITIGSTEHPEGFGPEFEQLGHSVRTILSYPICPNWNIWIRFKQRFGFDISKYLLRKDRRFAKLVIKEFESFRPDMVYVFHCVQLRPETLDLLRKNSFVVAHVCDTMSHFPRLHEYLPHYHLVYTYAVEDYNVLREQGVTCVWRPWVAPQGFRPLNIARDIDVSFVGRMYPESEYGERYNILTRLMKDRPQLKIVVAGQHAPIRRLSKYLHWLFDKRERLVFTNRSFSASECNVLYNQSKINLDMNHSGFKEGWSDRMMNILSTKSFVIAKYNATSEKEYNGGIVQFRSYDELLSLIDYYLVHEDERNMIATRGFEMHTNHIAMENGTASASDIVSLCERYQFDGKIFTEK